MKQAIAIVAVVVAIGLGWLIFGNKKDNPTTNSSSTSTNSSNQPASTDQTNKDTAATATDQVKIDDMAFSPADITVKKGTTVTWVNDESVSHTVTENDGKDGPSSPPLSHEQSYTFKYDTVGTFHYHCSIHPEMTGTVTVTE
ncbi:cupredoxin domain-containing protein [Candidatus Saccharibacteria bacterium]|nr:cupredoxin domain-containing protein [Candidatus Saccharibacteria bacterium]